MTISSFPFSQNNQIFSFSSTVLFSSLICFNWFVLDILTYISCYTFVIDSSGIVAYLHRIPAHNKSLFCFVKNKTICRILKMFLFQSKVLFVTCFVLLFHFQKSFWMCIECHIFTISCLPFTFLLVKITNLTRSWWNHYLFQAEIIFVISTASKNF